MDKGSSTELVGRMITSLRGLNLRWQQQLVSLERMVAIGHMPTLALHKVGASLVAVALHSECLCDNVISPVLQLHTRFPLIQDF